MMGWARDGVPPSRHEDPGCNRGNFLKIAFKIPPSDAMSVKKLAPVDVKYGTVNTKTGEEHVCKPLCSGPVWRRRMGHTVPCLLKGGACTGPQCGHKTSLQHCNKETI